MASRDSSNEGPRTGGPGGHRPRRTGIFAPAPEDGRGGTAAAEVPVATATAPEPTLSPSSPAEAAAGPASPRNRSRALAETVVRSLLDRLTGEATRRGGALTISDIRRLAAEFESKTEALQAVFERSFEEYVRARERAAWQQSRQFPFDRLIVRTFDHLFAGANGPYFASGALSRRMLPGFFLAMNMMLGEGVIEGYQEHCRAIVAQLQNEHGDAFSWPHAYADAEARRVTLDALASIAAYFSDLDRRADWFVGLINGHLGDADVAREGPEAAGWQMTGTAFRRFLAALFNDVRQAMATEAGRLAITRSHGAEACAALWDILKRLEAAGFVGDPS